MSVNKKYLVSALLLISALSHASVSAIKLSSHEQVPMVRWLYQQDDKGAVKSSLSGLVAVKKAQMEEHYNQCLKAIPQARNQAKGLQGWLAVVQLDCARKLPRSSTASDSIAREIQSVEAHKEWLLYGPQANPLRQNLIAAYLTLLEYDNKANHTRAWQSIEHLLQMQGWMNEAAKARVFRLAGELSFLQQNLEAAQEFYARSLNEVESQELRAKIHSIEGALLKQPPPLNHAKEEQTANPSLEASAGELELQSRVTTALTGGDLLPATEDAVQLIQNYPGGTRAKWAGERVMEAYISMLDKQDGKLQSLREKMLKVMEKVDADRLADWARTLYNRQQYADSLLLAKRALEGLSGSARSTKTVELAADSALQLEKYGMAKDFYGTLILKHSGTPSARRALFRTALIDFREKDYSLAASQLERLLVLPQIGNLELAARHWLWRALQKLGSDRAQGQAEILISKYPFSYYGLRARAEQNQQVLIWKAEPAPLIESSLWVTGAEKQTWDRVQVLLQAGWLEEAQSELKDLPVPTRPDEKALRARLWASALNYVNAARLVNEAWDENQELRAEPFLRVAFPKEFTKTLNAQADVRHLDRNLVLSLIKQESAFQVKATSTSNALGLMQIIPPTAREISGELKMGPLQVPDDLFNPLQNITMGTYYIAKVLNQFSGNVPLALAGYNAGPTKVERWLKSRTSLQGLAQKRSSDPQDELWFDELPWEETSYYVKAILRNLLMYRLLESGRVEIQNPIWTQTVALTGSESKAATSPAQ